MEFWFIAGSQFLYGPETLVAVEQDSRAIVEGLNSSGQLPFPISFKAVMKTSDEVVRTIKEANYDGTCAGIIVFMHTFSPGKMWINGLGLLQKPYLHFHTQFNEDIPNDGIDMDYMNLHQSAHGDREHGFTAARMRFPRKIVAGYWRDEQTQKKIGRWMRAAMGLAVSQGLRVMRFGDNMREVAVTEGDKVGVQQTLGWQVNTWPVGQLVEAMDAVTEAELDEQIAAYRANYRLAEDCVAAARYQAREQVAIQRMLDSEGCLAFTNTFQDLYGMRQLPGLATQDLMRQGYGYGGEGDWKVAALTAVMKAMCKGMQGGTSFMEDYTYDMKNGLSLGAHMLEVCPSIAAGTPAVEVHPLGIGDREPPARLVFEGSAGEAIVASLLDMGGRLRLVVQDIVCVKPTQTMPNLPVARVMWKPEPSLAVGAECWIRAGGSHHTVLSYGCDAGMMRDWARMAGIEFVHIGRDTEPVQLEQQLLLADLAWKLGR